MFSNFFSKLFNILFFFLKSGVCSFYLYPFSTLKSVVLTVAELVYFTVRWPLRFHLPLENRPKITQNFTRVYSNVKQTPWREDYLNRRNEEIKRRIKRGLEPLNKVENKNSPSSETYFFWGNPESQGLRPYWTFWWKIFLKMCL